MASFSERMIRAAKLDPAIYEEVEADPSTIGQAMGVVVLASLAAGIGSIGHGEGISIIGGVIAALASWFIWAYITYFIGTRFLPEPQTSADHGELLRTIGFSSSPGLLRILGIIPGLWGLVNLVISIWMLAAMIVAVRQALDYTSTFRAFGVCIIGWIIQIVLYALVFRLLGVT